MKTFTIKNLLETGYKEYPDRIYPENRLFQKTITNLVDRKLYFIDVQLWRFGKFSSKVYYFLENKRGFVVTFDINDEKNTIEEMEEFFSDVYHKMKCIPNIHNN